MLAAFNLLQPYRKIASKLKSFTGKFSYISQTLHLIWDASRVWTSIWAILLLIQGLLPAVAVHLTRLVVDSLTKAIGSGVSWNNIQPVLVPFSITAIILLLTGLVQSLIEWVRVGQAELVKDYVSKLVHQKSISIDFDFYESSDYHDHLNRARSNASDHSLALLENVGDLFRNTITILAIAVVIIPYGIWLPIVLATSPLPAFFVLVRLNRRYHRWWQKTTTDRRRLEYYETLITHSTVAAELRLFNFGRHFQETFQSLRYQLRAEYLKLSREQSLGRFFSALIALTIFGAILLWLVWQAMAGRMTLGDLALFYQALNQSQSSVRSLLGNLNKIYRSSLFTTDLFNFLSLEPKILNPASPVQVPSKLKRGIVFEEVNFQYSDSSELTLKNFNLVIPAGKIVAIVGDNGAGKSTLVKLLCRFYDPSSGMIEFDGIDIRDFLIEDLRRLITVLFQSPIPYHMSATRNITLGDLASHPGSHDVESAAKQAGVHEVISELPHGYETQLGKWFPNGTELSGGQWQRLALARAFYRKAQIIILDEPTSAMDPWAEADWLNRFRTLASDRTAIVITHRFTLAMRADVIHMMRKGQIIESGTHAELLEQNGFYAQSWREQMEASSTQPSQPSLL